MHILKAESEKVVETFRQDEYSQKDNETLTAFFGGILDLPLGSD